MELVQTSLNSDWNSVTEGSVELEAQIRSHGWHFMWLMETHSRAGIGVTDKSSISEALGAALKEISSSFNAAEVKSVRVTRYLGFRVARVTIHARHVQQGASLAPIGRTEKKHSNVRRPQPSDIDSTLAQPALVT